MNQTLPKPTATLMCLALCGAAVCASMLGGCREERFSSPPRQFFPDMDDSPKFKPQTPSQFFADGRSMRQPVAGTVAFGSSPVLGSSFDGDQPGSEMAPETMAMTRDKLTAERARLLKDDSAAGSQGAYTGLAQNGEYLDSIPGALKVDKAFIEGGMTKYNTFCAVCHGYDGKGKGTVGVQWAYPLPNFYDPKYSDLKEKTGKDGYLFSVVRNGVYGPDGSNKMPGYAHAIDEREAWAVVAYLRSLQASETGTLSEVPEVQRSNLEAAMRQNAAKPVTPAAPAAPTATPTANPAAAPATAPATPAAPAATPAAPAAPAAPVKPEAK